MNAVEAAQASGVRSTEADCCRVLGMLQVRDGNAATAENLLCKSLALAQGIGDPYRTGLTLLELGRAASDRTARQTSIEEAIRIFTDIGAAYDHDRALAALRSAVCVA